MRRQELTCARGIRAAMAISGGKRNKRDTDAFCNSSATPGMGLPLDTLKDSPLSPNKTLKWQGNAYRFFCQSLHTCVRNDQFQSLSLPVGDLLELLHVPEEVDISRNAQASRGQQESIPMVPGWTRRYHAAHSGVPACHNTDRSQMPSEQQSTRST